MKKAVLFFIILFSILSFVGFLYYKKYTTPSFDDVLNHLKNESLKINGRITNERFGWGLGISEPNLKPLLFLSAYLDSTNRFLAESKSDPKRKDYQKAILKFMKEWKPEKSEWIVIGNLTESEELKIFKDAVSGKRKTVLDVEKNTISFLAVAEKSIINLGEKKFIEIDGKKVPIYKMKGLNMVLAKVPLNRGILYNKEKANSLLVSLKNFDRKNKLSEDEFIQILKSIKTY